MLIYPQSELLREPNLLVSGSKPVGRVVLRAPRNVYLNQWIDRRLVLPNAKLDRLEEQDAEVRSNGVLFTSPTISENDHYTLYGCLSKTITERPFGFVGIAVARAASTAYSSSYGHFGLLKDASSSSTRSYCRGFCFRARPFRVAMKNGFGAELTLNTSNYTSNSLVYGDRFAVGFMSDSPTNHVVYARLNRGAIDTGSSSTDRTGQALDYDSISFGASKDYDDSSSAKSFPILAETMIVVQGSGVNDALMRRLIVDPYQFLVPA